MLSVLTPIYRPNLSYMLDAYRSLREQTLDQEWEWLIQVDGEEAVDLPEEILAEPRLKLEINGSKEGVAMTSNIALSRSRGELVTTLDHDDIRPPGSLQVLVDALREHPEAAFAFGRDQRIDAAGEFVDGHPREIPFSEGLVGPGELERAWRVTRRMPLAGAASVVRRPNLLAVGGMGAVPTCSDGMSMVMMNAVWPVVFVDQVVYHYRRHSEQTTLSERYARLNPHSVELIHQRLEALRELQGLEPEYDQAPEIILARDFLGDV